MYVDYVFMCVCMHVDCLPVSIDVYLSTHTIPFHTQFKVTNANYIDYNLSIGGFKLCGMATFNAHSTHSFCVTVTTARPP